LEYLNAAIKIGSRPGEPGLVPSQQLKHIWLLQGVRFLDAKRLPDAIATLRTAVQLYESAGGDDRGRPVAHLATALALSNELSEARATYEQALALSISDFETQWHAQCGLADIYRRTNEMSKAVDAYRDCVALIQGRAGSFATDEGKVAFLGGFQNIYDSYLEVAFTQSTLTHDWVSLRNAVETLRGRSTDALVDFRRRQALGTPGLLGAYDLGLPGEQSIRSQFAPSLPNPENVAAIVPQLEDDSAERLVEKSVTFLEYYVLQERTLVLVHTPDGVVHASSTLGRDRLRNLVQRYRHAIGQDTNRSFQVRRNLRLPTSKGSEDPNTMGADLYRALIEPVKSLLPGSEAPLVIVPHDVLWDVPFEALPVGGKEYVVDKYLISYASSSRQWSRQAAAKRPADHRDVHAWVIGNPRIDTPITACGETAQFDNLPGAEDEAKSIAAQIGRDRSDLFIGSAADRLRFLAWHPNYSVIHIAAHGFVCPTNPNASGILLASLSRQEIVKNAEGKLEVAADRRLSVELVNPEIIPKLFAVSGLLTAEQIALRFRFQADLVFLSACQSGAGAISGEGLLGFARAFEGAGARSLVLSLWLVGDQSARFLTSEFYAQYLKHGDKAKALRQAMLATRKMYPRVEDWAAFRLIGPGE
jgi:CHAT domain-containing protein